MMMRVAGSDGNFDLEALIPALARVLDSDSSDDTGSGEEDCICACQTY